MTEPNPDSSVPQEDPIAREDSRVPSAPEPWKTRIHVVLPVLLACALLASALVVGITQVEPDADEFLYMNMARAVLDGKTPYVDFFCAHMPGLLAPLVLLFGLFGPSLVVAKAASAAATACVFLLTYLVGRRVFPDSPFPAVFALTLLVTSVGVHSVSAVYLGVNLSLALALLGAHQSLSKRPALAGLFLGLSLLVRLSCLPLFVVFFFVTEDKKRFGLGAALPVIVFLSLFLVPNFLDQALWYHVDKTSVGLGVRFNSLLDFLWSEKLLLALALAGFALLRKEKSLRPLAWAAAIALAFAAIQKVVFPYYFNAALPFLALAGGGCVWWVLRKRLKPELLFVPNLALYLVVGLVNLFPISRGYRDDLSLDPAIDKARVACPEPTDTLLDLTGGTAGAYLSFRTGVAQTGGRFDWNQQRVVVDGSADAVKAVEGLLDTMPALVLTELEPGTRTIIWSKMRSVRGRLNKDYLLYDILFQRSKGRIVEFWKPRPAQMVEVDVAEAKPQRLIYTVSVVLADGKVRTEEQRERWGLEHDDLAKALNRHSPRKLVSEFTFADAASGVIFPVDDLAERKVITLRWVPSVAGKKVRMLVESFEDSDRFKPVSFVDATFEREDGTLARLDLYTPFRGRFYPTVRIRRAAE